MEEKQKYEAIARIQRKEDAKDIADEVGISYGSVLKLRREFEQAIVNNTLEQLVDTDKLLITEVGDRLAIDDEAVGELVDKIKGLELLDEELQKTALIINTRVRSLLLSIEDMSELESATDILCKLQSTFLNKKLTQVNVQNNYGKESETPKYNQFLSDVPKD